MENQEIKEIQESVLSHHELHKKAVEKHSAEIKTVKQAIKALETKKLADSESGSEEINKINSALKSLEDKLTTLSAQRISDKKYKTVDGLAQDLAESTPSDSRTNYRQLAKSILEDPFAQKYKKAFFKKLSDPYDNRQSNKALAECSEEIRKSSITDDESFIKKSLTTVVGEQAGYFCPPEVDLDIQKTLFETSPLRRVATVRNTTRGHYEFPIRTTLPTAYWGDSEIDDPNETEEQKYQLGKIAVNKLMARPSISLDMLEDSVINTEAELRDGLKEAFMLAENKAFINGTGIDQPKGIVEYAKDGAANYVVEKPLKMRQVNLDLSDYNGADGSYHLADHLLNLNAALISSYKRKAVYLMSRGIKNICRQVKDKNNQYLFSMGQNWGGVQGTPQIMDGLNGRINGYGILECDDLAQTLEVNTYPIFFGDFSKYVIIDRIGLRLIRDEITKKGMVIFWFRKRVGAGFKLVQGVVATKVVA